MTTNDHTPQQFWDDRYSSDNYLFGKEPNRFLVSQRALFSPKQQVLAAGDGEGRNGVWLAQQGLNVLAVDHSAVALAKAKSLAAQAGVALETEQADLATWNWGEQRFEFIVAIFIQFAAPPLRTAIHRAMQRALKPGGLIVLQRATHPNSSNTAPVALASWRSSTPLRSWRKISSAWICSYCASMRKCLTKAARIAACRRWLIWSRGRQARKPIPVFFIAGQ